MFAYLDKSERKDYNPKDFCFSFKDFSGNPVNVGVQQDTQEFLNIFFDKLETALKPTPYKNILRDVYGGKTINILECSSCGHMRTREEIYYNLSLEVKNLKSINEGFEKFITEDVISDYKCENCEQKCDVTKRTLLKDCPNILIIHLQRIIFDLDVLMNVKINTRYEFPFKMNLTEYSYENYLIENKDETELKKVISKKKSSFVEDAKEKIIGEEEITEKNVTEANDDIKEDQEGAAQAEPVVEEGLRREKYDFTLVGVLVHLGSAEFGHYYSYININRNDPSRPTVEDRWVEFNDSHIKEFNIANLEEECFGSGESTNAMGRVDDEFEMDFFRTGGRGFNIDK